MQGWHSQRLLGNGEIADPIIKVRVRSSQIVISDLQFVVSVTFCFYQDKGTVSVLKKDKTPKSSGTISWFLFFKHHHAIIYLCCFF